MSVPMPPHLAQAAPDEQRPSARQHLRVVENRRRSRARRHRGRLLMAVAAAAVVVFGLVYLHVVLAQRQFALDRVTTKLSQQETQYQLLRLKVAQLEAPARIISTAEGSLGMREPSSVTYLTSPTGTASAATPRTVLPATTKAPAGQANWPQIKSLLAGAP